MGESRAGTGRIVKACGPLLIPGLPGPMGRARRWRPGTGISGTEQAARRSALQQATMPACKYQAKYKLSRGCGAAHERPGAVPRPENSC
jgi:hypothetical protein